MRGVEIYRTRRSVRDARRAQARRQPRRERALSARCRPSSVAHAVPPSSYPAAVSADAVRDMQSALGFSDEAAHDMAILAMHQMADAMIALAPRLLGAELLIGTHALGIDAASRSGFLRASVPAIAASRAIGLSRPTVSPHASQSACGDVELVLVKSRIVKRTASAQRLPVKAS